MTKETKKAAELLIKKENEKAAAIAKAEKEITETKARLENLKAQLSKGETAEEYKRILSEIRDNEAVIMFFEKKKAEAEQQTLTPAEYMSITREVKAAAEKLRAEYAASISAEVEKLTNLLTAYDTEITEFNKVLDKAAKLHKVSNPMILSMQTLAADNTDVRFYLEAYGKARNAKELLKRGIKI